MMTYIESRVGGVRKVRCQVGETAVRMTLQPDKVTYQVGRGAVQELALPPDWKRVTPCSSVLTC